MSFKDVQNVFAAQGDYFTETLAAEKMPFGTTMYQNTVKQLGGSAISPAKLTSFELLLEYLKHPDAEEIFKAHATAYGLSLLDPKEMKNETAYNIWKAFVDAANEQAHFTDLESAFPGTAFGNWIPRSSNSHLTIHAGIAASELKANKPVSVCAVLKDAIDERTDKYEQEWNGFWRFFNVMQFGEKFIAASSVGLTRMDYLALPVTSDNHTEQDISTGNLAAENAWKGILELLFDDEAKSFAEFASSSGIPAPDEDNIGYEIEGKAGEVIATIEIAWPEKKLGFMTEEQSADREKVESLGWKILSLLDASDQDIMKLFGGDGK